MMAKQSSQEVVLSREEIKKQKREQKVEKQAKIPKRIRIRLIPIWLRLFLIVILVAASLVAGLMVGYGVIGDGNPKDALKKTTWTHIIDLVVEKK
ncbi:DNA-directed RNA polymerase subunit beta [Lederbergia citrea]|uniref:DNA-directed RNA polymerase subunit beta n=1 Tax=Lederbergia citrea TaxID=2833581 RepID=UPI0020160849|nr:DNA-directed RNA polymerase subunit beta [Lederbergia citrea]